MNSIQSNAMEKNQANKREIKVYSFPGFKTTNLYRVFKYHTYYFSIFIIALGVLYAKLFKTKKKHLKILLQVNICGP